MKLLLLLLTGLSLSVTTTSGQTTDSSKKQGQSSQSTDPLLSQFCGNCTDGKVLLYDFSCKTLFQLKNNKLEPVKNLRDVKIRYNDVIKFKVANVNRYIYNVGFTVDDIEFGSEPPGLFNQLFLGQGAFADELFNRLKTGSFNLGGTSLAEFESAVNDFRKAYEALMDNYIKAYALCGTLQCCADVQNNGKTTFSSLSAKMAAVKNSYYKTFQEVSETLNGAQKRYSDQSNEFAKCVSLLKSKPALLEELKKLQEKPKENATKIKEINDKITVIDDCDTIDIRKSIILAEAAVKNNTLAKETLDKIFNGFVKPTDEQLLQLVLFNNNLSREHLVYTAPPIYPQGHRLQFGLRIAPRDSASSLVSKWKIMPLYNDSTGFEVTVVNKWYVSFSSGVFTVFGDRLRDESYDWQAQPATGGGVTDSAKYKLVNTGYGASPLGFAALANLGVKLSKGFGLGLGVGAGISIEEHPKPVYLAGLSLMFGNRQQFNVTIGAAAAQVKKLKKELYPDISTVVYDTRPASTEYKKSLEAGGFVAVTYTLFTPGSKRGVTSGQ